MTESDYYPSSSEEEEEEMHESSEDAMQDDSSDQEELESSEEGEEEEEEESSEDDTHLELNDSECYFCRQSGDLLCCEGSCLRSFHLECLGLQRVPKEDPWLCPDCKTGAHPCFYCHRYGTLDTVHPAAQVVHKCPATYCGRFFHQSCLLAAYEEDTSRLGESSMYKEPWGKGYCPRHACVVCGRRENPERHRVLMSCIICNQASHSACAQHHTDSPTFRGPGRPRQRLNVEFVGDHSFYCDRHLPGQDGPGRPPHNFTAQSAAEQRTELLRRIDAISADKILYLLTRVERRARRGRDLRVSYLAEFRQHRMEMDLLPGQLLIPGNFITTSGVQQDPETLLESIPSRLRGWVAAEHILGDPKLADFHQKQKEEDHPAAAPPPPVRPVQTYAPILPEPQVWKNPSSFVYDTGTRMNPDRLTFWVAHNDPRYTLQEIGSSMTELYELAKSSRKITDWRSLLQVSRGHPPAKFAAPQRFDLYKAVTQRPRHRPSRKRKRASRLDMVDLDQLDHLDSLDAEPTTSSTATWTPKKRGRKPSSQPPAATADFDWNPDSVIVLRRTSDGGLEILSLPIGAEAGPADFPLHPPPENLKEDPAQGRMTLHIPRDRLPGTKWSETKGTVRDTVLTLPLFK